MFLSPLTAINGFVIQARIQVGVKQSLHQFRLGGIAYMHCLEDLINTAVAAKQPVDLLHRDSVVTRNFKHRLASRLDSHQTCVAEELPDGIFHISGIHRLMQFKLFLTVLVSRISFLAVLERIR